VPGYLLDSNHVFDFYKQEKSDVVARVRSLPAGSIILGCAISLGEIAAGHAMPHKQTPAGQAVRDGYVLWLNETFAGSAKDVTGTTGGYYAQLIGRIWRIHPAKKGKQTEQHLMNSGAEHKAVLAHLVMNGVDINDVWMAAVAWEHGLTLVTSDRMPWVREAAGLDVTWDCWISNA